MSKTQQVLIYLQKKPITSWEAITLFKATRLADIIFKLRGRGLNITTEIVQGENAQFARYRLHR
jgi:hypothetical protein